MPERLNQLCEKKTIWCLTLNKQKNRARNVNNNERVLFAWPFFAFSKILVEFGCQVEI